MTTRNVILLFAVAVILVGCASDPGVVHTTELYEFALSPQRRSDSTQGLRLVSIGHKGRVTVRDSHGVLWRAREGEYFTNTRGGGSAFRLKSVNRESGRIVIEGEMRVYF